MDIILAILLGSLFGFALYYAGASFPRKLIAMLKLEDLTLMKIILFAIGLANVLLFVANLFGIFDISHLSVKATNLGVLIGGLIFGFGFGWIGSCPGTCVSAVAGRGFKKALITILGGLVGAFAFSLTYGTWKEIGVFSAMDLGKLSLFNISEKFPSVFNIGFSGLLIMGLILMGIAFVLPEKIRK